MTPEQVINWLQSVDNLSSTTSIMVIAALLRYGVVPIAKKITSKYLNRELQGIGTITLVFIASFIGMTIISVLKHIPVNIMGYVTASITASLTAIGVHSIGKAVSDSANPEDSTETPPESPVQSSQQITKAIPAVQFVDDDPVPPQTTPVTEDSNKQRFFLFVNGQWIVTDTLPEEVTQALNNIPVANTN